MGTEENLPIRVSDAERDAVVVRLRAAVGSGRLSLDEFAERTEQALAARTGDDLTPLTADLPSEPAVHAPPAGRFTRWVFGVLGGGDRAGRWRVAPRVVVVNLMGGADLDLRQAIVSSPVTEIVVFSVMGGSDIIVPDGVEVDLSGFAVFGANDFKVDHPPPPPGAPTVRVRAFSLMGGTDVVSRNG